jgi:hypothetical protein
MRSTATKSGMDSGDTNVDRPFTFMDGQFIKDVRARRAVWTPLARGAEIRGNLHVEKFPVSRESLARRVL